MSVDSDKKYIVYRHIFPNGKSYIGITSQHPYWRRWRGGHGYAGQPKVWNAIRKYGWENVRHEVLSECLTLPEANRIEQEMVAKFNSVENGYYISSGGGGTFGIPCSEETKAKIGRANRGKPTTDPMRLSRYTKEHGAWNKGKRLSGDHYRKVAEERKRRCNKRIACYSPVTHELIKVYDSCVNAALTVGVSKNVISRCANGGRKTSAGYEWRYLP
jgi:group I intron endonuclease